MDLNDRVNLPGVEETVIIKAVPSRGGLALHSAGLKRAISPNVGDSDAQFLVVGDCVRASPIFYSFIKIVNIVVCLYSSLHNFNRSCIM